MPRHDTSDPMHPGTEDDAPAAATQAGRRVTPAPSVNDMVAEYLALGLQIIQRRWKLFLAPIAIALPLAALAVHFAPTTYVAKSLILMQSANRLAGNPANATARQNTADQISAIDAWLKSDQILSELMPQLVDQKDLVTTNDVMTQIKLYRRALTLELVGSAALEVRLEGRSINGLAHRLEIILVRLMEGLTGPEQGILSAKQFVALQKKEAAANLETQLLQQLSQPQFGPPEKSLDRLRQLYDIEQLGASRGSAVAATLTSRPADVAGPALEVKIRELRAGLSSDPSEVARLEQMYLAYQTARQQLEAVQGGLQGGKTNYVGFFEAPENLLIVGRPQDPITGESSAKKLAVAGVLLSILTGLGVVLLVEALDGHLKTQSQFVAASGLPVIARVRIATTA